MSPRYTQPSPSLEPPLLSPSWSPPPWGMDVPAGHPSALLAGVGAFDGVLDEPHAVSAPTATTEKIRSVTTSRIERILTRSPSFRSGSRKEVLAGRGSRFAASELASHAAFFIGCVVLVLVWAPSYFLVRSVSTWQLRRAVGAERTD